MAINTTLIGSSVSKWLLRGSISLAISVMPYEARASETEAIETVISKIVSADAEVDFVYLMKALSEDGLMDQMKWYGPYRPSDQLVFGAYYTPVKSIYGIKSIRIGWALGQRNDDTKRYDGFGQSLVLNFQSDRCPNNVALIKAIGGQYIEGPEAPPPDAGPYDRS